MNEPATSHFVGLDWGAFRHAVCVIDSTGQLLERFELDGKRPVTAIVVSVEAVYFQCARALMRSALWDPTSRAARGEVPSAGEMIRSVDAAFDAKDYAAALHERQRATL